MYKRCPERQCPQSKQAILDLTESTCPACGAWLTVELEAGDRIGGFQVLAKLPEGDGGMATVYKAGHRLLPGLVALKVCHDHPYEYNALQREAEALVALQHPHIVKIIRLPSGEGTDPYVPKTYVGGEPRCFIALEFIEGPSLRQRLGTLPPLTWPEVAQVVRQVGTALSFAHSKGFLHLDVKPSNILLARQGKHAVLTDFGLVRPTDTGKRDEKGRRLLGTAGYMSPEHIARQPLDYRADIFSLGVVLYEMLTGVAPFTKKSTSQTLVAVRYEQPVSPSKHNSALPPAADEVVMHALEKERANRYQSTRKLVEDLERALRVRRGFLG